MERCGCRPPPDPNVTTSTAVSLTSKTNVVNVLTARAIPVDLLDREEAEQALADAQEMSAKTPEEATLKDNAIRRARGKLRASR